MAEAFFSVFATLFDQVRMGAERQPRAGDGRVWPLLPPATHIGASVNFNRFQYGSRCHCSLGPKKVYGERCHAPRAPLHPTLPG